MGLTTFYADAGVTSVSLPDGSVIAVVGGKFQADEAFAPQFLSAGFGSTPNGAVTIDPASGAALGAKTSDGWSVVTNPLMRVRVTGPATATITGRDRFGATQVLGTIAGNSSDVLYAEQCIAYQVAVTSGTTVEVF